MSRRTLPRGATRQTYTAAQITALRQAFGAIERVNPDHLPRFHALLDRCDDHALAQIAGAGIRFLSVLARNEQRRRAARAAS